MTLRIASLPLLQQCPGAWVLRLPASPAPRALPLVDVTPTRAADAANAFRTALRGTVDGQARCA